jgi:hypothetical protein
VVRGAKNARLAVLDVSSARPSVDRQGDGGKDVTDTAPTKQRSPAAERMHLSRERRRKGLRCVPLEVRNAEIENLIKLDILDPARRNNPHAIAGALGRLLDQIPFSWWQQAITNGGKQ